MAQQEQRQFVVQMAGHATQAALPPVPIHVLLPGKLLLAQQPPEPFAAITTSTVFTAQLPGPWGVRTILLGQAVVVRQILHHIFVLAPLAVQMVQHVFLQSLPVVHREQHIIQELAIVLPYIIRFAVTGIPVPKAQPAVE